MEESGGGVPLSSDASPWGMGRDDAALRQLSQSSTRKLADNLRRVRIRAPPCFTLGFLRWLILSCPNCGHRGLVLDVWWYNDANDLTAMTAVISPVHVR